MLMIIYVKKYLLFFSGLLSDLEVWVHLALGQVVKPAVLVHLYISYLAFNIGVSEGPPGKV